MNAIIIDDNKTAAEELAKRLEQEPDFSVKGVAYNGFDGLQLVFRHNPQVLFLDVELPDINGIDFLSRTECHCDGHCRVVMYTSYDKFILPAFRKKAFDVLLKPIDPDEFDTILNRLREDKEAKQDCAQTEADGKYLLYTNSTDFRLVVADDICMFRYDKDSRCWEVVVAGSGKPVRLKRNVKSEQLTALDERFIQVHQKFIINMSYLIGVTDNYCRFYPPFDDITDVKVGRFYRSRLTKRFGSL